MSRIKLGFVLVAQVAFPGFIPKCQRHSVRHSLNLPLPGRACSASASDCLALPGSACCGATDDTTMNTTNLSLSHSFDNNLKFS